MNNSNSLAVELERVEEKTAMELRNVFMPFFESAEEWARKAKTIVITDAGQVKEMELAREARLELKNIRLNVDRTRKILKEESLRKGKAIDGMANVIKYLIIPVEEYLQKQENFVKLQEERLKTELAEKRTNELLKYEVETEYYNLVEMSENGYNQLLLTSKLVYEQRKETERKAEKERIALDKAEIKERKRMQEENRRLKADANKRERQIKIEREKQVRLDSERRAKEEKDRAQRKIEEEKEHKAYELQLKKEREEKKQIEIELRTKKEAEEEIKQEIDSRRKEARLAPDKKKLQVLAVTIMEIEIPEVTSKEAQDIIKNVIDLLNKTSNYIKQRCTDL